MAAGLSAGRLRPPAGHARRNRIARRERGVAPDPAIRRVERGERDVCDRGRRGKWRIDRRVERSAARKAVADQHPGHEQTEIGVHAVKKNIDDRPTRFKNAAYGPSHIQSSMDSYQCSHGKIGKN